MKFIIDAHLPKSLRRIFQENGHHVIHTSFLPRQNATSDQEIITISLAEKRVVVTKDGDFWDRYLLKKEPYKLLLVKTGNTSTSDLKQLFEDEWVSIISALETHDVVILRKDRLELI